MKIHGKKQKQQSHVDRIRAHLGYWRALGCSKTTLSWSANGIRVKFETEPPRIRFKPTEEQIEHRAFVHEEVLKLDVGLDNDVDPQNGG